jgi:hypothetical protein
MTTENNVTKNSNTIIVKTAIDGYFRAKLNPDLFNALVENEEAGTVLTTEALDIDTFDDNMRAVANVYSVSSQYVLEQTNMLEYAAARAHETIDSSMSNSDKLEDVVGLIDDLSTARDQVTVHVRVYDIANAYVLHMSSNCATFVRLYASKYMEGVELDDNGTSVGDIKELYVSFDSEEQYADFMNNPTAPTRDDLNRWFSDSLTDAGTNRYSIKIGMWNDNLFSMEFARALSISGATCRVDAAPSSEYLDENGRMDDIVLLQICGTPMQIFEIVAWIFAHDTAH